EAVDGTSHLRFAAGRSARALCAARNAARAADSADAARSAAEGDAFRVQWPNVLHRAAGEGSSARPVVLRQTQLSHLYNLYFARMPDEESIVRARRVFQHCVDVPGRGLQRIWPL